MSDQKMTENCKEFIEWHYDKKFFADRVEHVESIISTKPTLLLSNEKLGVCLMAQYGALHPLRASDRQETKFYIKHDEEIRLRLHIMICKKGVRAYLRSPDRRAENLVFRFVPFANGKVAEDLSYGFRGNLTDKDEYIWVPGLDW